MSLRVLGIDPGVADTGWAVVEGGGAQPLGGDGSSARLLASGIIRTPAGLPLPDRLRRIHEGVAGLLREHAPGSVAVEEMFFLKAAHTVRATLQARGVILLAAAQAGAPIREYNPRQVKLALTGSGAAAKPQMQRMVQATLGLPRPLTPDDVADAAAIAVCDLRLHRRKSVLVLDRIGGRP